VIDQAFSSVFPDIINNYGFLILVAIPPFVGELDVGPWVVRVSLTCLASSRGAPKPVTGLRRGPFGNGQVHASNLLDVEDVLESDVGRDVV